jgi:beta-glucosidase-like glycosyl hydrolase
MIKKVFCLLPLLLFLSSSSFGQTTKSAWVDSVFSALDLNAKIGQLLMVPVRSYEEEDISQIESQIKNKRIGGVVFLFGSPVKQALLTNQFQELAKTPLLIAMNAEEGVGSVLDSTLQFAAPLMLGAIQDDSLLYFLGLETGRQLKELGVHINFAPTADLSTSFENENLFYGSYGSNKDRVTSKVIAYQSGLQKMNILSVPKHYSDNGVRVQGFHKGKPVLKTLNDPNNFFPLQKLLANGSAGVVTAYQEEVIFPTKRNRFASKKNIVSSAVPTLYSGEYLKQQFNFKGLVFSFIPDIKALNKKFGAGDAEVFAFNAGNDVLLFPENINATVRKMRRAIRKDENLLKKLDESVRKVLNAKFDATLYKKNVINTENLIYRLNTPSASLLQTALLEKPVTLVKDDLHLLPIKQIENKSFASLTIGAGKNNFYTDNLDKYSSFTHNRLQITEDTTQLTKQLLKHTVIIAGDNPGASNIENLYHEILQQLSKQ